MNKNIRGRLERAGLVVSGLNFFVLLSPFLAWQPIRQEIVRLYFVYGIIVLYILSLFSKPKRLFSSGLFGLFLFWSLIIMFINTRIYDNSVTFRYLNFYIMSEGFIHIFFAFVLYRLIYEYVDSLPAVWPALAIYLYQAIGIKSLTPMFAFGICAIAYLVIKKKWMWAGLILTIGAWFCFNHWDYIWLKWSCRPYVWKTTLQEITRSPVFGYGFDRNVMTNLTQGIRGLNFRHNDYLNIARDLGLPALVIIVSYLAGFFKRFKVDIISFACLGFLAVCFFQTSLYYPRVAIIAIALFAVKEVKDVRRFS